MPFDENWTFGTQQDMEAKQGTDFAVEADPVKRNLTEIKTRVHMVEKALDNERYGNQMMLERKEILEEQNAGYRTMLKNYEARIKELEKDTEGSFGRKMLVAQIKDRDEQIAECKQRLEEATSALRECIDERGLLKSDIKHFQGLASYRLGEFQRSQKDVSRQQVEINKLNAQNHSLRAEIERLTDKVERYKEGARINEDMARKYVDLEERAENDAARAEQRAQEIDRIRNELKIENGRVNYRDLRIRRLEEELETTKMQAENVEYFRNRWKDEKSAKIQAGIELSRATARVNKLLSMFDDLEKLVNNPHVSSSSIVNRIEAMLGEIK